jgi:hypothetical protein
MNIRRVSAWVCPLDALRVVVFCLTLMKFKHNSSSCWKYLPLACLWEGEGKAKIMKEIVYIFCSWHVSC